MGLQKRVILSSFSANTVENIKNNYHDIETALISKIVDYGIIEKANQIRVEAIHPDKKQFENKTLFDKYIDSLYKLRVWTLNKKDELCDYLRLDLDGIFTNYPDIAKDIRDNIDFYQREK